LTKLVVAAVQVAAGAARCCLIRGRHGMNLMGLLPAITDHPDTLFWKIQTAQVCLKRIGNELKF
jgi:hypothetical protein